MKPSLWKLVRLLPSSSVTLGGTEDAISEVATLLANLSALCCCSSFTICSTGIASKMLSVAVGRMASTVKLQSSWFCSNRRRRLVNVRGTLTASMDIHTSPLQCVRRSCAVELQRPCPAHTDQPDSRHRGRQLQWRNWFDCAEATCVSQISLLG